MSDTTQARKQYKYMVLNSKKSDDTEERLNAAAADGFTVEHVIQGLRTSDNEWRYPALVLSKDAEPISSVNCSGCEDPSCDYCNGDTH